MIMSKPTVFFSHSSKDKEQILAIKDKLNKATGGVLDIFLSSDGQSIPFGTNWVHKVEQGLKDTTIMFVFATENSIRSGWIYFEAGFAYSKGIKVVPVGLGVSINDLKAPLSLLQGFDIESADSMNNIIAIINREFDYRFSEAFSPSDYQEIIDKAASAIKYRIQFEDIVRSAECKVYSEYSQSDGTKMHIDIDSFYHSMTTYLDKHGIPYSHKDCNSFDQITDCIVVNGIRIIYKKDEETDRYTSKQRGYVLFLLSALNFKRSFVTFLELLSLLKEKERDFLILHFHNSIVCISKDEDKSSILIDYPEEFAPCKDYIDVYEHLATKTMFRIYNYYSSQSSLQKVENVVGVAFDCDNMNADIVISIIMRLLDIGILKQNV
jgi:hypothetical protein